jgi:hypothetical protein
MDWRYILDGTTIADELHSVTPDESPYLGISLRQYGASRQTWIVEYLNAPILSCGSDPPRRPLKNQAANQ